MEPHVHRFVISEWSGSEAGGSAVALVCAVSVVCECGQERTIRTTASRAEFEAQLAEFNVHGEPAEDSDG
jgi:hypothetical protein